MKKLETTVYTKIKIIAEKKGYFYFRLEQKSFPDIFISKGDCFYLIEVKVKRKGKIHFEQGQEAFSKKFLNYSSRYILAVYDEESKELTLSQPII
jgi:Holliday junction resolvase